MNDFLDIMTRRGFIAACTDLEGLRASFHAGPVCGYVGFDATARSLHVGHLVNIMMLRWLERTGNRPVVLLGEGTSLVGDPSFRSSERPLIDHEAVLANSASMSRVFHDVLDIGGKTRMVSNADWLSGTGHLDFMRDVGRHFTVSRMLSFESVQTRLGDGLSFLEFGYMLLQAADFLHLFDDAGCVLQMGGSDQWGNILNGVNLIRRARGAEAFGLTCPLLTRSDGAKMGKSGGQAVWLRSDMTSDFDFWQFWRNTPDADVRRFLLLFTELPVEECDDLGRRTGSALNEGKIALANSVTTMMRGEEAARAGAEAGRAFTAGFAAGGLPEIVIDGPMPLFRALVAAGLCESSKAAKRQVSAGVTVGDEKVNDPDFVVPDGVPVGFGKRRVLFRF